MRVGEAVAESVLSQAIGRADRVPSGFGAVPRRLISGPSGTNLIRKDRVT